MTTLEALRIAADYAGYARQTWKDDGDPALIAAAAAISQAHSQLALAYCAEAQA